MLSPHPEQPENKPTSPSRESAPSLTIYAHKISSQISDVRSLLSSSTSHIAEDREKLHKTIEDTKCLIVSHEAHNKRFEDSVENMNRIVTEQQNYLSFLSQTLINLETAQSLLQDNISTLSTRIAEQNYLLQSLTSNVKTATDKISHFQTQLDTQQFHDTSHTVHPDPNISNGRPTRSFLPGLQIERGYASLDTIPPLPVATGEVPVLEDTTESESDNGVMVSDTPAPANKPIKIQDIGKDADTRNKNCNGKGEQNIPTKKSKSTNTKKKRKWADSDHGGSQRVLRRSRRRKRSLSLSLGAFIEGTPNAYDVTDVVKDTPVGAVVGGGAKGPVTPVQQVERKRILAGPATQEAWENDSSES
ncbi:hypothetical protein TWF694_005719 [Orbilia ellipsospora]|uniref:Uncharacterized protein n=1 Tax=Orbilia ellipsospora TaxID=2528407 RepID=A0AAV9WTW3_9PEZI